MKYAHVSKVQRCELLILLNKGYSQRSIAKALDVHVSTISRELKRNSMHSNREYSPLKAQRKAYRRRKYSKYEGMKINRDSALFDYVTKALSDGWTPEEISGRLKKFHNIILGFKTIYKWIYSVSGRIFAQYLPSKRDSRKKRRKKKSRKYRIPDRVSIHTRPLVINERKRIGDFEGDTMGKPKHTNHTLVAATDRKSRYLVGKRVFKLAFSIEGFREILPSNALSLTMDNGPENVRHKEIGIQTYFCDPYSSWQKGTIENTFKRVRRYIPKKADLADYSDKYIAEIIEKMNNTPRKCLGYRTPAEVFKEHLQH